MFQTRTALVTRLQALESGLEARIEQNPHKYRAGHGGDAEEVRQRTAHVTQHI